MESLGTPSQPGIALVLRREIPSELTADSVLAIAREAGLDGRHAGAQMRGLSARLGSGITKQLYFMWFDVPGFDRFRQVLASRVGPGFTAGGLSPVLMMAAEPGFTGWMPVVVDQNRDCIAPVTNQIAHICTCQSCGAAAGLPLDSGQWGCCRSSPSSSDSSWRATCGAASRRSRARPRCRTRRSTTSPVN